MPLIEPVHHAEPLIAPAIVAAFDGWVDAAGASTTAAEAIANMKLGRIDHETTANVGVIEGGAATNIIPNRVVLRAEARSHDDAKLDAVIDAINGVGYGLTCSIHSRVDSTVEHIRGRLRVGNLYVNRNQIGAVVGVQPFGGEGLSGTGPKAGGPRYLHRFALERSVAVDTTASGGNAALLNLEE